MTKKADAETRAREALSTVAGELAHSVASVDAAELIDLVDAVEGASRVFVTGCGRSGLAARAFAMRLTHLGLDAHVIGETTAPPCGERDLVIAISGSGEKPTTLLRATEALSFGCKLAAVTGNPDAIAWHLSKVKVVVPPGETAQFGGSLFEQSALAILDAAVMLLRERLDVADDQMRSRHANVE